MPRYSTTSDNTHLKVKDLHAYYNVFTSLAIKSCYFYSDFGGMIGSEDPQDLVSVNVQALDNAYSGFKLQITFPSQPWRLNILSVIRNV